MQLRDDYEPLDLDSIVRSPNFINSLDDELVKSIGVQCCNDYDRDELSRDEWFKRTNESIKLAMQVAEDKSYPWPQASNIKFPLVTIAALQFHSRTYAALFPFDRVAECRSRQPDPTGQLEAICKVVANNLNEEITEDDPDWMDEMDRLLLTLPIVGCAFKKTYRSAKLNRTVSEQVFAQDFVVNYSTSKLDKCRRMTHVLYLSRNDVQERIVRGIFSDESEFFSKDPVYAMPSKAGSLKDDMQGVHASQTDDDSSVKFIEQYRYIDLDGDGYEEPYIVTMHYASKKVARIVANFYPDSIRRIDNKIFDIKPETYFTKYPFIPSPDGGFYDIGFGYLLGPINESVNSILNQLVDAGTLSNMQCGFLSREVRVKGGQMRFTPGEWKRTDATSQQLRDGVVPMPVRDPSNVLFTLLELLVNYGERIGISVDVLVGKTPGQNTPAETTRNATEQGMMIFSALFKRTYRALKRELKKYYRLNQLFGDDRTRAYYAQIPEKAIAPAADPNVISDQIRLMRAQLVLQAAQTMPGFNKYEAARQFLEAAHIPGIDVLLPPPGSAQAVPPEPNPKLEEIKIKAQEQQLKQAELELKAQQQKADIMEKMLKMQQDAALNQARILDLEASAELKLTQADSEESKVAIAAINAEIGAAREKHSRIVESINMMRDLLKTQYELKGIEDEGGKRERLGTMVES